MIEKVRPDQLDGPTPCGDLDVRALLGHVVFVLRRVAAIGRGENAMAVQPPAEPVADDAWVATYAAGAREVQDSWTDAAALERIVTLPWATFPGAGRARVVLERAHHPHLGPGDGDRRAAEWDEQVTTVALAVSMKVCPLKGACAVRRDYRQLPAGARSMGYPFGEAVAVPDDAPADRPARRLHGPPTRLTRYRLPAWPMFHKVEAGRASPRSAAVAQRSLSSA